jgi:hypothetical protein
MVVPPSFSVGRCRARLPGSKLGKLEERMIDSEIIALLAA